MTALLILSLLAVMLLLFLKLVPVSLMVIILLVAGVLVTMTLLRWFEQTTDAVDARQWDKVFLLVVMPFAAWKFPSRFHAGRPTAAPRHEPVRGRGFGGDVPMPSDQPPPGTPAEFLTKPKATPPRPVGTAAGDAEKMAKLRQKLKDQGMIDQ